MNVVDMLGPDMAAAFGSRLRTIPSAFFYDTCAAESLAQALRAETSGKALLVFSDSRTRAAAGGECLEALSASGWSVNERLIPDGEDGSGPVCNDTTMHRLQAGLGEADAYVAMGSGVVNDLTKWLAVQADRPYAVYATAASMNGYAAANVAPTLDGVKALFRARAPRIIAANPDVLEAAPSHLTSAGLGDVMAKPVSTADWFLNHLFRGEAFSKEVAGIIDRVEPLYLNEPEALSRKDAHAVRGLFEALVLSGCAMTLQGSSLPASGGEHLISHTLDMKAGIDGRPHDLHGRQVGVATIFAAALYRHIIAVDNIRAIPDPLSFDASYWGPIAGAVEQQYVLAQRNIETISAKLQTGNAWDNARAQLAPMLRNPEDIQNCLRKAGAAYRMEDIGCTKEQFCDAVRHSACIRERFTSIDLGYTLGILPNQIENIVEECSL